MDVNITVGGGYSTKPDPPTGLTATSATSSQISLAWTASVGAVAGYKIYRDGSLVKTITSASTLTYADTGLTASTPYCYRISATDAAEKESPQTSQLCATTYGPPPTDPGNLTTFVELPAKVILNWSASVGATGYYIYRNGTKIVTVPSPVTATTYTDTAATANGQNIYKVTAVDATGGESSGLLNQVTVNTALTVPTMSSATPNTSAQITIGWTNAGAGTGVAGYKIYRNGVSVQTIPSASTLTYADSTGLSVSTQYCYRVSAIDTSSPAKESAQSSASLCATTYGPPPTDPGNLTTFVELPAKVILNWSASVGATGYYIYRNGTKIVTVPSPVTATTYTDTAATANGQNIYKVTAVDATGGESSGLLNQVTVNTALTVPTMSSATPNTSAQITIGWTNAGAGTGVAGYKIYRNGVSVQTIPSASTLTYADSTGLSVSTQYCYRVSAIDTSSPAKESAQSSASLCATTYSTPPAIPAGVMARVTAQNVGAGTATVNLSWTASADAYQYYIYRDGSQIITAAPITGTSYTDTATVNALHTYTVVAVDKTGSASNQSSQSAAYTGLMLPTLVSLTADSSTQITFTWSGGGTKQTGYKVYRTGLSSSKAMAATSLVDGGLTPNTQYCYSVSATDAAGNESAQTSQLCAATSSPPSPASIDLLVSSPQLNSDGASTVALTALVKDSGNRAMSGQAVTFADNSAAADSGIITVTSGTTDATGKATATLGTGGNKKYRTINLTASSGAVSSTNTVDVVGTTVSIQGATTLAMGGKTTLTIFLKDSSGTGISGKSIALASAKGNTVNVSTVTTDASGQATVDVTAAAGGADTITATCTAMNRAGTLTLTVSATTFSVIAPTAGQEVNVGGAQTVQVHYAQGVPAAGVAVNFTATRGTLSATSALTDAAGNTVPITITSTTAGPAVITASVTGDTSIQQNIEFVAVTVASMNLQANPTTIGTNKPPSTTEKSTITAVVYDLAGNLVKNKTIDFELTDVTGGAISPASVLTDSLGKASTVYTSSASDSAVDGVTIRATVRDTPAITKVVRLTVAKKAKYITLGTSNSSIQAVSGSTTLYEQSYSVMVTDAMGNPVANATVNLSIVPINFIKGYWEKDDANSTDIWLIYKQTPLKICPNEDILRCTYTAGTLIIPGGVNPSWCLNGFIDTAAVPPETEDKNGNNRLDPGGVATVPSSVTTDANGYYEFKIIYGKAYAPWVYVQLQARTATSGSDAIAIAEFTLPYLVSDLANSLGYIVVKPPDSPFGKSNSCENTD